MALEAGLKVLVREPIAPMKPCVWQDEAVFNCLTDPASLFNWVKGSSRAFRNGLSC